MATFLELQTKVRRRLIDAPASVVAEVPDLVNRTIRAAQKKRNFQTMRSEAAFDTVTDERVLGAVPADFKEYRGKPIRVQQYGGVSPMKVLPSYTHALALSGSASVGAPMYILETIPDDSDVRNWEVWPLADGNSDWDDGEYHVIVPYWRLIPELVDDDDENWFTIEGEDYVIAKATAEGFELDWDMENSTIWETLAKSKWNDLLQADSSKVFAHTDTLIPYPGAMQINV